MTTKAESQNNALTELRKLLKPGTTVHTILRHTSSSGMSRAISAVVVNKDGSIFYLDGLISMANIGFKLHHKYDGLSIGGAGMDMGFHLVYSLSRALYPNGFKCSGQDGTVKDKPRCLSNDHSNYYAETRGQESPEPNYKKGKLHSDGGYALAHHWL